jgi:hypothetical protein
MTCGATLRTVSAFPSRHGFPGLNRLMHRLLKVLTLGRWPRGRSAAIIAGRKKVWRITPEHPQGTWVEADTAPARLRDATAAAPLEGWATSSMDLRDGVQVVEVDDAEPPRPH